MERTVLIVDDNALVRDVVGLMLQARGCAVFKADDGSAAHALLRDHAVDLALVDVEMPGIDGVETCRLLCAEAARADRPLRVWLMTGIVRPELQARAFAAGARGVLSKPFTSEELMRCMASDGAAPRGAAA